MWRASLVLLAIAAGATAGRSPARAGTEQGRTKYHMRQQLGDMRTIERMLVAGKLEDAKSVAFMLRPFGEAAAPEAARDFEIAVAALRSANALDEAIHAEVRVATACAHCHVKAKKVPRLKTPSQAPPDRPTIEDQMARHQWAVDRVQEGLISASDQHWRAGLYVIATSPLPRTKTHAPKLAKQLQAQARAALSNAAMSLAERADAYAQLLITCMTCHGTPDAR